VFPRASPLEGHCGTTAARTLVVGGIGGIRTKPRQHRRRARQCVNRLPNLTPPAVCRRPGCSTSSLLRSHATLRDCTAPPRTRAWPKQCGPSRVARRRRATPGRQQLRLALGDVGELLFGGFRDTGMKRAPRLDHALLSLADIGCTLASPPLALHTCKRPVGRPMSSQRSTTTSEALRPWR
jgi:hypothetical protein